MLQKLFSCLRSSNERNQEKDFNTLKNLYIDAFGYEVVCREAPVSLIKHFFSEEDNRKQFIPDGEPFQGEFDTYFDIHKAGRFYGFYRICLLPDNILEIHCGFVYADSLLARTHIEITKMVLKELQVLFPDFQITSECSSDHTKANTFLSFFCFEKINSNLKTNCFLLNRIQFKNKFT